MAPVYDYLSKQSGVDLLQFQTAEMKTLVRLQDAGHLAAWPGDLSRPLRDGLRVTVELRGVDDGDRIALAAMGRKT